MRFSQKVSLHHVYFVVLFSNLVSMVQIYSHLCSTLFSHSPCHNVDIGLFLLCSVVVIMSRFCFTDSFKCVAAKILLLNCEQFIVAW